VSLSIPVSRYDQTLVLDVPDGLKGRDFLRVADWSGEELLACLDLADRLKAAQRSREEHRLLPGRTLGMIFQKPSTRTRVSFEAGIAQLGGTGLYLFAQSDVEELAAHADVPVINGLTDEHHPCQALADVMTIRERLGRLEGVRVAYVGDGNNVCVSLAEAAALVGMDFVAATPAGYEPPLEGVELTHDPREAARGADVLYTDVWTSMGQEEEREARLRAFAGYQVNELLVREASSEAIVLHCLPAHYGEEITEEVAYGPRSALWDEAENRLHAQKALLALVVR
jgi:ornithine carbamoyltransferase